MAEKASLADLHKEHTEVLSGAEKLMEEAGNDPTDEQMEQLREAKDKAQTLRTAIEKEEEKQGVIDGLRAAAEENGKVQKERSKPVVPAIYGDKGKQEDALRTIGEEFIGSDAYKAWLDQFPQGGPSRAMTASSSSVKVPNMLSMLGMRTPLVQRAIVTAADASAGTLVRPDYRGLLEPGLVRPLTIRQLVTVVPTQSDAIEYVKETSRTKAAAPVAEATALTGTSGTKPEGALVFELVTDTIKTIAEWIAATKRIVADATGLRAYMDQFLRDDLSEELEDQMLSGAGTGENFRGILNTTGIGDVGAVPAGGSVLDSIREAVTLIRVNAQTAPNAVVLNPTDSEKIDLLKRNNEVNNFIGPGPFSGDQPRLWGIPRVESSGIAAGTFLVGDFRKAVLFDREDTAISVGTVADDFIRNIVRVLAELRAGFGVLRPAAFVKGAVP